MFLSSRHKLFRRAIEKGIAVSFMLTAGWINGEVHVATTPQCIGLTGQPIVVKGDTMRMARIKLAGGEHQLQLHHHKGKCMVESQRLLFGKLTVKTGAISQIVQSVSLLYQTSAKARCHITIQSPLEK
ncbi:hypothetical protein AWI31_19340 [Enterobacter hormaechei subsp. xiangfangensis]|nr:hypothetical protein AWI31_19340 [Enterobacter hormaechei subsp. xiangfangensis]